MELDEIQAKILETSGKSGLAIFAKGRTFGKGEGQKVKSDPLSKEVGGIVSQAVTSKSKDGYVPPAKNTILASVGRKIPLDKDVTRNNVKSLIKDLILYLDSMPKPEKSAPTPEPSAN